MSVLEVIIGLEVHAQVASLSKMFCACGTDTFGEPPNTTVCPVCMGHPGALPVPNHRVVEKAVRALLALHCTAASSSHFDRKNYFYPDLPAGFQISQYTAPLGFGGRLSFSVGARELRCGITRLHLENDAGKLTHRGGRTLCDYNRAGTPLMEIVTEPDLRSSEEAVAFAQELRLLLRNVEASDAEMYKGQMRFDASISLRPKGEGKLYPRSEIKNLNSFESLLSALQYEERRLRENWDQHGPTREQVTVGWMAEEGCTQILREKETAADYRYFPEPDIPPLDLSNDLQTLGGEPIGEDYRRPFQQRGFPPGIVPLLLEQRELGVYMVRFYDLTQRESRSPQEQVKLSMSVVLTQLQGFVVKHGKKRPPVEEVATVQRMVDESRIPANVMKLVLEQMVATGKTADELVAQQGFERGPTGSALREVVQRAIAESPQAVADYRSGKSQALAAVVGWVMKETKGSADPILVQRLLKEELAA